MQPPTNDLMTNDPMTTTNCLFSFEQMLFVFDTSIQADFYYICLTFNNMYNWHYIYE